MTSDDRQLKDDDLYERLIDSICREELRYAHEVEDGVIEVVFAHEGDLRRARLLITRRQLRDLVTSSAAASDDLVDGVHAGSPLLARLEAVAADADEALTALRVDESFVAVSEGSFVGSTRSELPPSPGTPDSLEDVDDGLWSAYLVGDQRFGEPDSILGARPGGEADWSTMIVSMSPVLDPGRYVFCQVESVPVDVEALVRVREEATITLVVEQHVADDHGWEYAAVNALITVRVHSIPGAVDLTSDVTGALAERGIGCRVVAGLRHDRLFVPHDRGWDVLQALEDLRDAATGTSST